jgi:polar amino acid transport system ATP-binding protein
MKSVERPSTSSEPAAGTGVMVRGLRRTVAGNDILRGIDLDMAKGSVTAIIGPSGSGKSTLLRCIGHLERPSAGTVRIDGHYIAYDLRGGLLHEVDARTLARRRSKIGMVFQSFNLFSHLTVLENIVLAPNLVQRLPRSACRERARALLEQVRLADREGSYPHELSGGQQQRVAIARALAMEPQLLLMDEPTSALDPALAGEVISVIRDLAHSGITLMIVTHEMRLAREISDAVVVLDKGRVAQLGRPEEVLGRALADY